MAEQEAKKNRGIPKFVVTDRIAEQIEKYAALNLTLVDMAALLGVSVKTLHRRNKDCHLFKRAIRAGKAKGKFMATKGLMENVNRGNLKAQQYYLENVDPEHWKSQQTINHEGDGEGGAGVKVVFK